MLPKRYRLKNSADFRRVYRHGRAVAGQYAVLYCLANHQNFPRVGFSVSKKLGKAHERNRIKRLLRAACQQHRHLLPPGYDIIFIARDKIKGIGYTLVEKQILALLRRGRLIE